jgi:hypothetical protein
MTNNEYSSLIGIQSVNQSIDSLNIEMVSRFIQNHDMRLIPDKHTESHPTLLAPTALVHRPDLDIPEQSKAGQMASILLHLFPWEVFLELF